MGFVRRALARLAVPLAASSFVASGALDALASAQEVPLRRVHVMSTSIASYGTGDWDGDGDQDLVGPSRSLALFDNEDHGLFEARAIQGSETHFPIRSLDLDSNGLADIVTVEPYSGADRIGLWVNPGDGAFVAPTSFLDPPPMTSGFGNAAAGDVDDDGDVDLYAYYGGYYPFQATGDALFLNDGSGAFPVQGTAPARAQTQAAALADFDRDGDLDLIRSDGTSSELWQNDGSGLFALSPVSPPIPSGTKTFWLTISDVNVDGALDFLVGDSPHLYLNNGNARFEDRGAALPTLFEGFHVADVDGDEYPDLVAAILPWARGYPPNYNIWGTFVLHNDGRGGFEIRLTDLVTPRDAQVTAVVDVDSDHDLDLVGNVPITSRSWGPREGALWLNDGAGVFAHARDPWETATQATSVLAGDFDGDSFPDVLGFGGSPVLYRSLRDGGFREEPLSVALPYSAGRPSSGDVDGDGDLDVIATSRVLLENDGRAGFTDASSWLPAGVSYLELSDLGDLDLDGDPDLLVIESQSQGPPNKPVPVSQSYSWINDATGRFAVSPALQPSLPGWSADRPRLGDVDADGDLDAWILGTSSLWMNDGSGVLSDASSRISLPNRGSEGAFADMDGDGDLDFLSKYSYCLDGECESSAELYLNDGAGIFAPALGYWEFTLAGGMGELSVVDIDVDGDVDALTAACSLWLNDGTGRLEDESYELSYCTRSYGGYSSTTELTIADFDRDGDPDLWYPGVPRPVMNTTRHVSWRSYPRAGKPLTMEVFGPAGTPFQLFSSTGFTEPQVTDMGFLRLATRGARLVATGTLDAEGKAAVTLAVPSDIALPEHTVYWQALVGSPPRLTNLESTIFRNL